MTRRTLMGDGDPEETEERVRKKSLSTSPCAQFRTAYYDCFNRWYSEKFLKGQWEKEECVTEWQKYRDCLSKHMDGKLLNRLLEADTGRIWDSADSVGSKNSADNASKGAAY